MIFITYKESIPKVKRKDFLVERDLFLSRIAKLRSFFSEKGLDSLWIKGSENRRYLSGFKPEDIILTESAGSLLVGKDFEILLTDPRYELEAKETLSYLEIKILKNNLIKEFCDVIMEKGIKKLGFEQNYVSYGDYAKIKKELQNRRYEIELIPLEDTIEQMRKIKDSYEIAKIKESARIAARIMDELKKYLKPGVTEKEIAFKVQELAYLLGADSLSFPPIVASGPNSALPHAVPTERRIKENEPVIIDIGVKVDGYCSDITRTYFINGAKGEFEEIYSIVKTAQKKAMESAKEGIRSNELDRIARSIIEDKGYGRYFSHGLGHGVGLSVHEDPRISKIDNTVLKSNMVVTIEPGIYLPKKGGVRIEDMIIIQKNKCEVITNEL